MDRNMHVLKRQVSIASTKSIFNKSIKSFIWSSMRDQIKNRNYQDCARDCFLREKWHGEKQSNNLQAKYVVPTKQFKHASWFHTPSLDKTVWKYREKYVVLIVSTVAFKVEVLSPPALWTIKLIIHYKKNSTRCTYSSSSSERDARATGILDRRLFSISL